MDNTEGNGAHDIDPALLGRALGRVLAPPSPSPGFRARLLAAVQRAGDTQRLPSRQALSAEYERQVEDLRRHYVRLQWRTLGTLLGAAFVCGVGLALAAPWIREQFGDWGLLGMAGVGAVVGIALGARSWLRGASLWNGA